VIPQKKKAQDCDIRTASINALLSTAAQVVEDVTAGSNIFQGNEDRVPYLEAREVTTGQILGRGGFCVVRTIERIRNISSENEFEKQESEISLPPKKEASKSFFRCLRRGKDDGSSIDDSGKGNDFDLSLRSHRSPDEDTPKGLRSGDFKYTKEYITAESKRFRRRGGRYVLKSVSKETDKITYMKGNVDIAMEAKFLQALNHPNIIDLVAISLEKPCTAGFFLVLEKMTETLTQRIKSWMDKERLYKGVLGAFTGGKKKEQDLYIDRIAASYDIASGLFYLHSKNIVFRDLKPDNVGYDFNGRLKLFDFGLAKELKREDLLEDGTYRNMTGLTGAIRYMAPEVGLGNPYNNSVDVYSWAMVTWFILALEPPFGFFTESMIRNRVHQKGVRPAIFRRWAEVIGEILKCSWGTNFNDRPNFLEITLVLKQELIENEAGQTVAGSTGSAWDPSEHGENDEASVERLNAKYRKHLKEQSNDE